MKKFATLAITSLLTLVALTGCDHKTTISVVGAGDNTEVVYHSDNSFDIDISKYQKEGYIFLGCYSEDSVDSRQLISHKGESMIADKGEVPSTIYALYEKIEEVMTFTYKADNANVSSSSTKTLTFATHPALNEYLASVDKYALIDMNFLHFEHVEDIAGVGFYNWTNYKIISNNTTLDEGALRSSYQSTTFTKLAQSTSKDVAKGLSLQIKSPDSNYSTKSAEYTNLIAKVYVGPKDKILNQYKYSNLGGDPMKFNVQNPSMVVNAGATSDTIDFILPWNAIDKLQSKEGSATIAFSVLNYGRKLALFSNWAKICFTAYDEYGIELANSGDVHMENNGGVKSTSGSFSVPDATQLYRIGIRFWRPGANASTMFYYVHAISLSIA